MSEFVLRNGLVMGPDGPYRGDVAVAGGTVVAAGEGVAGNGEEIDCAGAWIGPGLVDVHVHLREPGQEWKEDIASGSAAAARGGYTAVVAMPNTDPPIDAGHVARYVEERGAEVGRVDVRAAGCITAGRAGTRLAHLDDLFDAGVRIFTDDGDTVADAGLLRRAMEYLADRGGVVAQHCIDPGLAAGGQMHEGEMSSLLGMAGIPAEAEETIVARDLALVRLTGCRYHVQHVSTAGTVALIAAAKTEGLPVTAEVTPHHLMFDHTDAGGTDPVFKMMPPLRTPDDVAALRSALRDGVIDMVATDHAPHADHEKDVPWEDAPFGITGLEWAAAAVHSRVGLHPATLYERMALAPARFAGLEEHGRWIEPGIVANLMVFDPEAPAPTDTISRSSNAPYPAAGLRGAVRHTILRGTFTNRSAGVPA